MVEGGLGDESIHLSHAKLYRPEAGGAAPALTGFPHRNPADYNDRDGFMAACDLKIALRFGKEANYKRATDFLTGECIVTAEDARGRAYSRRVVALRGANIIAIKIEDAARHDHYITLAGISPSGWYDVKACSTGMKETIQSRDYYRATFSRENPWNPLAGYEVALYVNESPDKDKIEAFAAIEPTPKSAAPKRDEMMARLKAAAQKGYDALLAEHAPAQKEMMERVSFSLEGPEDAGQIVRNFNCGRYNIISSTGGDHIPNLQGLWAGTWSAPWFASFTVNGNLPCAISFFDKGRTPELNECLLAWLQARLPEMRQAAKMHFNARGFRAAAQTTIAGVETDSNPNYPHVYWHGGAPWLVSRLYDGYRHTLDTNYLRRIYPLMKELAHYYEDVLVEMPDGTLGFNPSYSPENSPRGKRPLSVNATMDNAIAKQFLDEAVRASEILGVDEAERESWRKLRARLTPYQVSKAGFFAEWLAPGQDDNNEHRHASHLYALYDNAPAEIVTNAAFTAAIKKTIDARMDFNENRSRTMAFGYVQNGLAACKLGDAARAERCLKLLNAKNWLEGGGSCHDWQNCFNTDISGGYPYLVSEMLVYADENGIKFLPAKPDSWRKGEIKGLLLRGNIVLESLSWEGENYRAILRYPDGSVKKCENAKL